MSTWDAEYEAERAGRPIPSILGRLHDARAHADDDGDTPMENAQPDLVLFPDADQTPLQQLIRHWMNERHSPDILVAQDDLLSRLLDHIRRQSNTIQLLRNDPSTSEEEHMRIVIAQIEVERVKFVVRSYLRTRLFKIEKYARHIVINPNIQTRLSQAELDHASRLARLTDHHYYNSVLQSLPPSQVFLDDAPPGVPSMGPEFSFCPQLLTLTRQFGAVPEPDKARPVFIHARQNCGRITFPDGNSLELEKGYISLCPYAVVEHLVVRGEVELV